MDKPPEDVYKVANDWFDGSDNNGNAFFTQCRNRNNINSLESGFRVPRSCESRDTFLGGFQSAGTETQSILDSSTDLKNSLLQLPQTFKQCLTIQDSPDDLSEPLPSNGTCVDGTNCTFQECNHAQQDGKELTRDEGRAGQWSPFLKFPVQTRSADTFRSGAISSSFDDPFLPRTNGHGSSTRQQALRASRSMDKYVIPQGEADCGTLSQHLSDPDFNTPPSSPVQQQPSLNGWFTAPNTPEEVRTADLVDSFEDCRCPTNFTYYESDNDDDDDYAARREGPADSSDFSQQTEPEYTRKVMPIKAETNQCVELAADESEAPSEQKNVESAHQQGAGKVDIDTPQGNDEILCSGGTQPPVVLVLPTPPLIDANCLLYEADPETGKAKSIGKGSFGQVFKAQFIDPLFSHYPIVVKEFDEEFTSSKEVCEECQRLIYLRDTGYVPICYGLVALGDPRKPMYGIVQEYVGTGLTLEMFLWERSELPYIVWISVARQCCEGLARFHEKGILLNDIKTNNILLDNRDNEVVIKYIDFGLATDMKGKRFKNSKSLEDFHYLAPEIRHDGKRTTIAADVYSLGYMLEQIQKYTDINDLNWVIRLCMKELPSERISAAHATKLLSDLYDFVSYEDDSMVQYMNPPRFCP